MLLNSSVFWKTFHIYLDVLWHSRIIFLHLIMWQILTYFTLVWICGFCVRFYICA